MDVLIALIMEIASTSETLVNFYQATQHYNQYFILATVRASNPA
jgi:hypothetical protein